MNKLITSLTALLGTVMIANASLLGVAGEYNAFAFEDIDVKYSDAQGKVAAGGNVTIESGYSVGEKSQPSTYSLISGGNVTYKTNSNGTIFNGGIYAAGNVDIHNGVTVNGDVTANGTLSNAGATIRGNTNVGQNIANPIDFESIENSLKTISKDLSLNATNALIENRYGGTFLTGTQDINYFNIDASLINDAWGFHLDMDENSVAIINVYGDYVDFSDMGFNISADAKAENILFNIVDASNVNIRGVGFKGQIVATNADIDFNNGHIDGSMIAKSISGNGQFHNFFFNYGEPPQPPKDVPEPSMISLILAGCGMIFFAKRRKK